LKPCPEQGLEMSACGYSGGGRAESDGLGYW